MWRAPISAEFTVYCFKNLNLSVQSPWTWATTCLQRALIKCLHDTWVLGGSRSDRQKPMKWLCPPMGLLPSNAFPYYVPVTAPPGLWRPHSLSRKKVREHWVWWEGSKPWARQPTRLGTLGCWVPWAGQRELFRLHHLPLASESSTRLPGREGCSWLWMKESAKMPPSKEATSPPLPKS